MKISNLFVGRGIDRGFAIVERVLAHRFFEADPGYCPDPDDEGIIPGQTILRAEPVFIAERANARPSRHLGGDRRTTLNVWHYSLKEAREQVDALLGVVARDPIPF
jgi:hypothetical protein